MVGSVGLEKDEATGARKAAPWLRGVSLTASRGDVPRERLHRHPSDANCRVRHWLLPRNLSHPVDRPEDGEKLAPDRCVGREREVEELTAEHVRRPLRRDVLEVGFDVEVTPPVDSHAGASGTHAHRVALVANRGLAGILDADLLLEEAVLAVGREQDEEPLVPQVLNARRPRLLPPRPSELRDGQVVAFDDATVDVPNVSPLADAPRHVEVISVPEIRGRELLDETVERRCLAPINEPPLHPFPSTAEIETQACDGLHAKGTAGGVSLVPAFRASRDAVGGGREICSWHKSPEKPGSKTFGVSSSTPEFAGGSLPLPSTFLLEVAQSMVVAALPSPDVVLNLKTHLGRASPFSRHARTPFRGTLA